MPQVHAELQPPHAGEGEVRGGASNNPRVVCSKTPSAPATQVLGGGGYTIRNVARCWAYETAIAVGQEDQVGPQVPSHAFFGEIKRGAWWRRRGRARPAMTRPRPHACTHAEYYGPDYELHVRPDPGRKDENDREVLDKVVARVLERLSRLGGPPSTELKERPESLINDEVEVRPKARRWGMASGRDAGSVGARAGAATCIARRPRRRRTRTSGLPSWEWRRARVARGKCIWTTTRGRRRSRAGTGTTGALRRPPAHRGAGAGRRAQGW